MKKTVLTFGLLSGVVLSLMMLLTMPFHDQIGFDRGLIVGYTTMILAALFVYFGVRSYRDNVSMGTISFGRAFLVGMLISLVATAMYVTTWELSKNRIAPDYMAKYQEHVVAKGKASGKPQSEIDKEVADVQKWAARTRNPLISAALTSMEPLPVALLASLISAAVLRRKRRDDPVTA